MTTTTAMKKNAPTCCREQSKEQNQVRRVTPAIDLYETAEAYVLAADVPGATADGVDLKVEGGNLILDVKANHAPAPGIRHGAGGRVYHREFSLGRGLSRDAIHAKLQDGVLTVTLPKCPERQSRKIAVEY